MGAWWLQGLALSFVREWVTSTLNGYLALWLSVLLAAKVAAAALSPTHDPVPHEEYPEAESP